MSHEIRTPLNVACMGMESLKSGVLNTVINRIRSSALTEDAKNEIIALLDDARAVADDIFECSKAAVMVLNDLLNYDKIENKSLKMEISPLSIEETLKTTLKPILVQAKQNNIQIINNYNFDDPESSLHMVKCRKMKVLGDSIKIGQVIRNIVSNAIKFSQSDSKIVLSGKAIYDLFIFFLNTL